MPDKITLTLPCLFVGQMLDALRETQADWQYTQAYHLGDGRVDFDRLIKSDSNAREARKMADFYGRIIEAIELQMDAVPASRDAGDLPAGEADARGLVAEYEALIGPPETAGSMDWPHVEQVLERDAEWTTDGAMHVADLARYYGSFMLRNALALAVVLGIEDGESGM